jgi:hypothetical protein
MSLPPAVGMATCHRHTAPHDRKHRNAASNGSAGKCQYPAGTKRPRSAKPKIVYLPRMTSRQRSAGVIAEKANIADAACTIDSVVRTRLDSHRWGVKLGALVFFACNQILRGWMSIPIVDYATTT